METPVQGPKRTRRVTSIVERLEVDAARDRALVETAVAVRAGLTRDVIALLVREGRWHTLARGVHAVVALDGGPLQACDAALRAASTGAFLHRSSAALVLGGLDLDPTTVPCVAVPEGSSGRTWPRRSVPDHHLVVIDGLRTTDGLLTLLDLASEIEPRRWEWALEATLRRRLTTIDAVEGALAAPGRKDRSARAAVEAVLHLRPPAAPPTDSLLETRFLQLVRDVDVPTPTRQHPVRAGGRRYRVDVSWPDLGIFVELDGQAHRDQPVYDAHRETAIVAATGWLCGRFTWAEVTGTPRTTARKVTALVTRAVERPLARKRDRAPSSVASVDDAVGSGSG